MRASYIISRMSILNTENNHLYIVSDFQENTIGIDGLNDTTTDDRITLVPIENKETTNISIDSCLFS